jgi:beta-glucosidase/6-phospho-beta-glucosidase/beta-galactosidase
MNMTATDLPRFNSFVMAGFECTYALAENRRRLDLLAATKHDERVHDDYAMIKLVGITTAREGFAWSQIDQGNGQSDFARYTPMLEAGWKYGIQQIWDLNHFDYPADLDPFSDEFVTRFAAYAKEVVQLLRKFNSGTIYIVPLNEISFFAWIGADMGWWAPYAKGRENGFKFKTQLVKAAMAAMESIWDVDKDVRFIHVDPFMRRKATEPASKSAKKHVKEFNEVVRFEAWDMLCGKVHPEVGGDPKYLDILGVNYYIHNQEWVISEAGQGKRLKHQLMDWESPDRISFALMLKEIHDRYQRPMIVSESGSFGENRIQWWTRTLQEVEEALDMGLPIGGICAYPIMDRPESAGFLLPNSGLWDFEVNDDDCRRIPHEKSLNIVTTFNAKMATN